MSHPKTIYDLAREIAADPKEREYLERIARAVVPHEQRNKGLSEDSIILGYRKSRPEERIDDPENSFAGMKARLTALEAQMEKAMAILADKVQFPANHGIVMQDLRGVSNAAASPRNEIKPERIRLAVKPSKRVSTDFKRKSTVTT
jgi:hypothetical protein